MKIIIVGCGKVGYTLVEQLGSEDHDIVVIDEKPEKVSTITNNLDAMGIVGNGINHQTLIDAGITTADLLIAVTGDDEKNLLCCVIARKTGHCQTVAFSLASMAISGSNIRRTLQRSNASSYLSVNPESPNGSSSKRFVPIT